MYIPANSPALSRRRTLTILTVFICAVVLPLSVGSGSLFIPTTSGLQIPNIELGKLPLLFEPNAGQENEAVRFKAHTPGGTLFFTPSEVVLALNIDPNTGNVSSDATEAEEQVVRLSFIGANANPTMLGDDTTATRVSYFLGSDPTSWHTEIPTYAGVTYSGLYPGIDLHYEGSNSNLKGTYIVAPGADPSHISWRYNGAQGVSLDNSGNLQIALNSVLSPQSSVLTEAAPVAWQEIGGQRVPVEAHYALAGDGSIGFALGSYDANHPLVIDPTLTYSTYIGGNFAEYGFGIAADSAGYFYVVGMTNSSNFPTVSPYQPNLLGSSDGWVARFNPQGQPVYITYLGGNGIDYALDVATDGQGNAYVTGFTSSANFPTANAFQPAFGGGFYDAFITKLNPAGSALVFSTYLGGNEEENSHGSGSQSGSIALDTQGNIYVTGFTQSENFPVLNAIQPTHYNIDDLFITKLNPSASALVWSTYLGGLTNEQPKDIAVDSANNVYVTGFTDSGDFPLMNPAQPNMVGTRDVFVTKINAAGTALVYSTYWGGNGGENGAGIAVDSLGNAYIAGDTDSNNFPVLNAYQFSYGGFNDAFVSKFGPTGTPVYSTYLGGDWVDGAYSVAVNAAGEAYAFGSTQSEEFPVVNPIIPTLRGSEDAFVTHFNAAGNGLVFSTFFGGSNGREMQGPGAMTVDAGSNIYITGNTGANDLPTVNPFQPFPASAFEAFISRISENSPTPTPTSAGTATPTPTVCAVADYTITQSTGATIVPGTTFLPNSACNDCTAPLLFPFPVQFYNQTFTQGRASSNGNLQFVSNNHLPFNSCLPNPTYDNVIYGYWDDLFLDCQAGWGCGIYTSVSGSAPNRIFNIEWRAHRNEPPIVNVRFEIRLYESGNGQFDIIYGQLDNPGNTASVGVQRDTGSRFTQYSCDQGILSQGLKLAFTLPSCQVPTATSTPASTATATSTSIPQPTLLYSSYFSAWERDSIEDIGKDAAGNIYVAGTSFEQDINYGDIRVAKFSPDGQTLLWQRLLGGTRIDYGYALTVDAAGNATVAGIATSNDYPLLNPLQGAHAGGIYDTVITKLDPQGNMIFSTYLGGSGTDYAERLATDATGNIYLTGMTSSTNWPTTAGAFQTTNQGQSDGYVTKITPNGSAIVWSTYLGGLYSDSSNDIALDATGNIYLTGFTASDNFPLLNPFQSTNQDNGDAFVTKMNSTGSALIYSTYLGGSNPPGPGEDNGQGITVDATGHAYVTGFTEAPDYPVTAGAFQPFFGGYKDAFVTKLTPAGNQLVYSTFLGGSVNPPYGEDIGYDIAIDSLGQAHITGKTYTPDFPIVRAVQPVPGDVYDAFVTKFNASGSGLIYSTFLGGDYQLPTFTGQDAGMSILIDGGGNAVIGGGTGSYNFPVVNAYQYTSEGAGDGFIAKISGSFPALTPTPIATATRTSTPPQATSTSLPTQTPGGPTATPVACAIEFADVPSGHTFYSYIQCLACRGIITGYPCGGIGEPCNGNNDSYFRPQNNVTRGQIAKIVSEAAGFNEPVSGQTFEDAVPGSTFYEFIERLASRSIMQGYPCGNPEPCMPGNRPYFRPNSPATRGQLAKIVSNAANYQEPIVGQTFEDVLPGSTFYDFIERLATRSVMSGYPCGSPGEPCVPPGNRPYFRPSSNVTRGQTSKIVANTFYPECQP